MIAADGEDIPYGRPYSIVERVTNRALLGSRIVWSFLISVVLIVAISEIADLVPSLAGLSIVAAPGMFAALLLFPAGGHSDWAYLYLILAVVIDGALYTWPVLIALRFFAARLSK